MPPYNPLAYLQQNAGAGAQLGQRVVGEELDPARLAALQQLGGLSGTFSQQAQAGTASAQPFASDVANNPEAIASDPARLAAYQQARAGTYGGPNALSDVSGYSDALGALAGARAQSELGATQGGREQLVAGLAGPEAAGLRGRRTAGTERLDAALLGGGGAGALAGAQQQGAALGGALTSAEQAAQAQATAARGSSAQAGQQLRDAEAAANASEQADLQRRLGAAGAHAQDLTARLQAALRVGKVSKGLAGEAGIDRSQLQELLAAPGTATRTALLDAGKRAAAGTNNVEMHRYLQRYQGGDTNYVGDFGRFVKARMPTDVSQIATAQDRARLSALGQLSGSAAAPLATPATPWQPVVFNASSAEAARQRGLQRAAGSSARQVAVNAQNGGPSFFRKYGRTIGGVALGALTGGLGAAALGGSALTGALSGGANALRSGTGR